MDQMVSRTEKIKDGEIILKEGEGGNLGLLRLRIKIRQGQGGEND